MTLVPYRDCKLCGFVAKNAHGFSIHLRARHALTLLEYAERYEGFERPACVVCGRPARYKGEGTGKRKRGFCFYATCSDACRATSIGDKHRGIPRPENVKAKEASTQRARWAAMTPERREEVISNVMRGTAESAVSGTSLETIVADLLVSLGIRFEPQVPVGKYIVDFFLQSSGVYLEADGCFWHGCETCGFTRTEYTEARKKQDRRKDAFFKHRGLVLVRVAEHDVRRNPDLVKARLLEVGNPEGRRKPPVETERGAPVSTG